MDAKALSRKLEAWPSVTSGLVIRHGIVCVVFIPFYLILNLPGVLLIPKLGFTAWYPAVGLLLAQMLGVSPWYSLTGCIAGVLAGKLIYHQPLLAWSGIVEAIGGTIFYAVAAYVLRGPLLIDLGLRRRRDVVRYGIVTLAAAVPATLVGVSTLALDHTISWTQFWSSAFSWYIGDAIGLLGFAPFLLIHLMPWVRKHLSSATSGARTPARNARRPSIPLEVLAQGVSILLVLWIMFGPVFGPMQLLYLGFVPIIWVAVRNGIKRAVIAILAVNFGMSAVLHFYPPIPMVLAKVGLLMLVLSATGLIVGSAVTERHRLARQLRERTHYLKSLTEHSPFGILVLDQTGAVELCNDAFERLLLFPRSELIGHKLNSTISGVHIGDASPFTTVITSGQNVREIVRWARKDGSFVDVEFVAVPLNIDGRAQGAYAIFQDISDRVIAAKEASEHAEALKRWVKELQSRTREMTLLSEMSDMLQSCATLEEAYVVFAHFTQKIYSASARGVLFVFKSSRNVLECTTAKESSGFPDSTFAPSACWALRHGRPHWSFLPGRGVVCPHLKDSPPGRYLCVPMMAQGDTLGIFHLQFGNHEDSESFSEYGNQEDNRQRLATTVAGQLGLSLASLRLRETLRDQSIRDALTGLFNRRFYTESLDREFSRARRKHRPLAVAFLDIDHFKRFNDSFGHEAGDEVLRSLADTLRKHFRGDDVVCRYGGEEFAVILPETTVEGVVERANDLRAEVKKLALRYREQKLGQISLSIGIAGFPDDASTAEELIRIADECLYESKARGRDRTSTSSPKKVST